MTHKTSTCPFVNKIPNYIRRNNKPRTLGMIIATLEESPERLSSAQISQKLKDKGYRYYPATRTCASILGKYTRLFEPLEDIKVTNSVNNWKVKLYKLRDDWNVDREV